MADKFFVDTNILIYAHDRSAGIKHQRARHAIERLWTTGQGVLSTQILQELCINLRRKLARPLPLDEVRRLLQDYLSWEITRSVSGTQWFCRQPSSPVRQFFIPKILPPVRATVRFR
jgi:predicted nucleic acid-binding protein